MKKDVLILPKKVGIISASSVAGKKENQGLLSGKYDIVDETDQFEQKTWEQSESEMQRLALKNAMEKSNLNEHDIEAVFAGDLTNQCVSSNYGLLDYDIPFFGLYGACSTFAEGLIIASLMIGNDVMNKAAVVTSSHNCTAERQFRYPLEYGGQHTPTSQWTVTGSGAMILSQDDSKPYICDVLPGRSVDKSITDINNMGAAMAPAAVETLIRYFKQTETKPNDYDKIITGDLGYEGHRIVTDFMQRMGYDMSENYTDCGLEIYDRKKQDVHSGGSGCGCSALGITAGFYPLLCSGELRNILFIGTGALMSPMSNQQGLSIPGIAHLVHIKSDVK